MARYPHDYLCDSRIKVVSNLNIVIKFYTNSMLIIGLQMFTIGIIMSGGGSTRTWIKRPFTI